MFSKLTWLKFKLKLSSFFLAKHLLKLLFLINFFYFLCKIETFFSCFLAFFNFNFSEFDFFLSLKGKKKAWELFASNDVNFSDQTLLSSDEDCRRKVKLLNVKTKKSFLWEKAHWWERKNERGFSVHLNFSIFTIFFKSEKLWIVNYRCSFSIFPINYKLFKI